MKKKKVSLSNEIVVSVDMQKVITLPRLPGIKQAIFCKRLVYLTRVSHQLEKSKK